MHRRAAPYGRLVPGFRVGSSNADPTQNTPEPIFPALRSLLRYRASIPVHRLVLLGCWRRINYMSSAKIHLPNNVEISGPDMQSINAACREVLTGSASPSPAPALAPAKAPVQRKKMSAAARKRISDAAKARWAKDHKAPVAKKSHHKKTLTAGG